VLRPLNTRSIVESIEKTMRFLVVEELGSQGGGLWSQVAQALVGSPDVKGERIGVTEMIHSYGSYDDLLTESGITAENIGRAVERLTQ
jgi:transketolase C-terminal domain/subunit